MKTLTQAVLGNDGEQIMAANRAKRAHKPIRAGLKVVEPQSHQVAQKTQERPNAGKYEVRDNPPPPIYQERQNGYPWRRMAVGQFFFVPNPRGKNFKVVKRIKGCEDWRFRSYTGIVDGVEGRIVKRVR